MHFQRAYLAYFNQSKLMHRKCNENVKETNELDVTMQFYSQNSSKMLKYYVESFGTLYKNITILQSILIRKQSCSQIR